jgi:hypothetical protein
MDPHLFGSPGSGSELGMRIKIHQEQGNMPNLTKINLISILLKMLLFLPRYVF